MPIMFKRILQQAEIDPSQVRLLRHQDTRSKREDTPYALWRDRRAAFDSYQSHQAPTNRPRFGDAAFWASFVATPSGETMFVGLYRRTGGVRADSTGMYDVYDLALHESLADLAGRMFVDWGMGLRSWIQRGDRQDKAITELRRAFQEPHFPGFSKFIEPLSKVATLPRSWIEVLRTSKGVYLLTCPKTKEQYVGSAIGENGFWGRWQSYLNEGHGGNIGLRSRDPSDYQVSILEVTGTYQTDEEILALEQRWKAKLQSREMGLNRN